MPKRSVSSARGGSRNDQRRMEVASTVLRPIVRAPTRHFSERVGSAGPSASIQQGVPATANRRSAVERWPSPASFVSLLRCGAG